jgi:DNA polymerase-3 subunit epsilon
MSNLTFITLDFETATSQRASVCEVGMAFVENGELGMSRSNLIRPPHNQYDSANIAVHGITPIMTDISPGFEMFWSTLANILQGKTVVAHYAPFDMGVIREECLRCGLPFPQFRFVCSCALARFVLPGFYSYGLEPLCDHFGIATEGHHRAGTDALMTAKLMLRLCEIAEVDSIDSLVEKYRYRFGNFDGGVYTPFHRIRDYSDKYDLEQFAKDYQADASGFDEENPFYNKEVVFTGTMARPRHDLMQMVMDIGGRTKDSLTRSTDFLVVGQQDFRIVGEEGMSGKQKKAMEMIAKGAPLQVLSEAEFLMMINT